MYKVIDLFSGVGGLSLGAARAGFGLSAAVELDGRALATHKVNFPKVAHLEEDVALMSGKKLTDLAEISTRDVFGVIGGPPCQGFSDIGLRSVQDPRNQLFSHFFRLVSEIQPAFYMAENVPGVLSARNDEIRESALGKVPSRYRMLEPITVKASDYGAPTTRTRVFFIGYDPDRLGPLAVQDFLPKGVKDVRVRDALRGIPAIRAAWQSESQGWRKIGDVGEGEYANKISGHVPENVGNVEALYALEKRRLVSGFLGTFHGDEVLKRFKLLRPGERDSISRSVRLDPHDYCPTLRAGTGPERGSYQAVRPIHPTSNRVIAPREAARLQGFPDWFQFHPTKWHAFRQIGNSVSPIVAEDLLRRIALAAL